MNKTILNLLLSYPDNLLNKDCIIDYFTKCKLNTKDELQAEDNRLNTNVYVGKIFKLDEDICTITTMTSNSLFEFAKISGVSEEEMPFLDFHEDVSIDSKFIKNLKDEEKITTTLGRFLLNHTLLVMTVGDKIPYINDNWDINSVGKKLIQLVMDKEIGIEPAKLFINTVYFLSSYSEFVAPSLSEAAITVDPRVIELRNKLFEQYKDQLNDPEIMIKIEKEVIALDKEILSHDPEAGFLSSAKNFNVHRKRMFLMMGLLSAFGDEHKQFNFSTTNLDDGWKIEDLDTLFNEVRSGSYGRAKETAKGGAESKYLGRTFQEAKIVEDDCGTKKGIHVSLNNNNIENFLYRTLITGSKNPVVITKANNSQFIGKDVIVRSPMFCIAKNGYCYSCMDERHKTLGTRRLNIQPLSIGSTFLTNSMKKMHGSAVDTFEITADVLAQASVD